MKLYITGTFAIISLTAIALSIFSPVKAMAAGETKDFIAVVDIQKVLQESSAANDIREQMKAKRDKYQEEITRQEESLRSEEKKLSEQKGVLSAEAFEAKKDAFKEKLTKVQRDVQVKRSHLDSALNESLSEVQKVVYEIINELAKEEGFKIALPTSVILYVQDPLSITDEVLSRLNTRMPKVLLKTPEKSPEKAPAKPAGKGETKSPK